MRFVSLLRSQLLW